MRMRSKRWKLSWTLLCTFQMIVLVRSERETRQEGTKGIIFPRMDYNQWKPLGQGDPLKDDPTFDYVPPVLDHVHYWEQTTEEGPSSKLPINETLLSALNNTENKKEILLLGVSSKKPAVQVAEKRKDTGFDNYLKYADNNAYSSFNNYQHDEKYNSKFYENQNQRIARPSFFPSMASSVLPSFMNFASKIFDRTAHSKDNEVVEPQTILVPPPLVNTNNGLAFHSGPTAPAPVITQRPFIFESPINSDHENYITSTPTITIEESNLIYHSSGISNQNEFGSNSVRLSSAPSINWQLPSSTKRYNDFHSSSASVDSVPLEKHSLNFHAQQLTPPDSFMKIKFSNHNNLNNKLLDGAGLNHNVNYVTAPSIHKMNFVTPPPLTNLKFKGHVSDDHEISNTYVKIEKPQAQMHSTGVGVNNMPMMPSSPDVIYSDIITNPSYDKQTMTNMQTLQPPAPAILGDILTQNPIFIETGKPLLSILKKEQIKDNFHDFDKTNLLASESMITNAITAHPVNVKTPIMNMEPLENTTHQINTTTTTTTTTEAPTTTVNTLTTDPLFKHYKQPLEPIKDGPLYLIIQGHSKVKTYKPAKQIDGIMIQETNEIPNSDAKYEHLDFDVKHLHHIFKTIPVDYSQRQARSRNNGNLQTLKHLAQTGYGKIDFVSEPFTEAMDKNIEKVLSTMQPTNYNVNYNLNRMIKEVKGISKEVVDALMLARTVTESMDSVMEMTTEKAESNLRNENIQETEVKSVFEVGNVDDSTSARYHKGIVEAARQLNL